MKFKKDDLKLIVKDLVRESLLEILAEEFIEEATFRAVESASTQIVGTVTKQINHQLAPIMERINKGSVAPRNNNQYNLHHQMNVGDEYIETLDDDYESVSVTESLGLSLGGDMDALERERLRVKAQIDQERAELKDANRGAAIGFDDEEGDSNIQSSNLTSGLDISKMILSSESTLKEQRAASSAQGMYDISDGSAMGNSSMNNYIDKMASSNKMKELLDRANAKAAQKKSMNSPIPNPSQMAAQQHHVQQNLGRKLDPMLDRPAHEVSNYAKANN